MSVMARPVRQATRCASKLLMRKELILFAYFLSGSVALPGQATGSPASEPQAYYGAGQGNPPEFIKQYTVGNCTYRRIWSSPAMVILNASSSEGFLVSGIVQIAYKSFPYPNLATSCPGRKAIYEMSHYTLVWGTKRDGKIEASFENSRSSNPSTDDTLHFAGTIKNGRLSGNIDHVIEDTAGSLNPGGHQWTIE